MGLRRPALIVAVVMLTLLLTCVAQAQKKTSSVLTFDFVDADIRSVLLTFAEVAGKNMVVSEDVKGKVTMKLDKVSWDEALDVVLRTNGLEMKEEDKVVRILTAKKFDDELKRDIDRQKDLQKEREARVKQSEYWVSETVFLNFANAKEFSDVLRAIYKDIQIVPVIPTNALVVYTTPEKIADIKRTIKDHDVKPPMIQIEARIVQVTSTFTKELGVQWGANFRFNSKELGNKDVRISGARNNDGSALTGQQGTRDSSSSSSSSSSNFPYLVNLPAAVGRGSGGALGVFIGSAADSLQLDLQLSALESQGKAKIISHPKVVTSDNKAAKISQGKTIPYQTVSQSGTQTQFADAVLGLEVTPQATRDGNVRLKISATKNSADFINSTDAGPTIDKREAVTEVIIRDGQTAVIGGIYETTTNDADTGVPFLRKIPLLKWLFNNESTRREKSELLIFITPTILQELYAGEG